MLYGQRFALIYKRKLTPKISFETNNDYSAAYNYLHKYSANSVTKVTVLVFWRIAVTFTSTDNYLNNAVPGLKRNAFRFSTSLTYRTN